MASTRTLFTLPKEELNKLVEQEVKQTLLDPESLKSIINDREEEWKHQITATYRAQVKVFMEANKGHPVIPHETFGGNPLDCDVDSSTLCEHQKCQFTGSIRQVYDPTLVTQDQALLHKMDTALAELNQHLSADGKPAVDTIDSKLNLPVRFDGKHFHCDMCGYWCDPMCTEPIGANCLCTDCEEYIHDVIEARLEK